MPRDYAELLVVLRYRRDSDTFDVSLAYDGPNDAADIRAFVEDPLAIDVTSLGALAGDVARYGQALTDTLFRNDETRSFYDHAVTKSGALPINLRILVDPRAPRRYHAILWETLRDPNTETWIATSRNVRLSQYLSKSDWRPISLPPKRHQSALVVVADPVIPPGWTRVGGGGALEPVRVADEVARARHALQG